MRPTKPDQPVIFRRYRKLPNGQILDARKYGLKAWPIRVGADSKPKT